MQSTEPGLRAHLKSAPFPAWRVGAIEFFFSWLSSQAGVLPPWGTICCYGRTSGADWNTDYRYHEFTGVPELTGQTGEGNLCSALGFGIRLALDSGRWSARYSLPCDVFTLPVSNVIYLTFFVSCFRDVPNAFEMVKRLASSPTICWSIFLIVVLTRKSIFATVQGDLVSCCT